MKLYISVDSGGVERAAPRAMLMEDADSRALYRRFVAAPYLARVVAEP